MITLRQISNITGFSVSTVSKALNDGIDVSLETKKYIQDIAIQNNYVPNKAAISLRKNKTNIIAIILPQVNLGIYGEILFIMQKLASNYEYRIMIFQSLSDECREQKCLKEINDGSVDGVIVISSKENKKNYQPTIPVSYLKVVDDNLDDLKKQCINNFNQLLNKIA
ncbi:LacI family DNA-binding transcriptional regulator [Tenacibaculum geojense]|uniref:LacI family DNA-binding transcriptional regulator n=1 Tax=Tenacibaculum geojense TaxID=915352 RepID=A0ABW3JT97_9FLAO